MLTFVFPLRLAINYCVICSPFFPTDTGYTERYMDLPEENKDGYTNGSVLSYINQFPDE